MPSENEHITAFRSAVINKIDEKIQAHDESNISHEDIRTDFTLQMELMLSDLANEISKE